VHIFLCASVDSIDNVVPVWAGLPEQDSSCAHMQGTCATPMIKALQIAMVLGLGRFRIDRDMLMYFKLRNYKKLQSCTRTKAAMIHDRALKKSLAMTTRGSLRTTHDAK
jgi:hypothetical protein